MYSCFLSPFFSLKDSARLYFSFGRDFHLFLLLHMFLLVFLTYILQYSLSLPFYESAQVYSSNDKTSCYALYALFTWTEMWLSIYSNREIGMERESERSTVTIRRRIQWAYSAKTGGQKEQSRCFRPCRIGKTLDIVELWKLKNGTKRIHPQEALSVEERSMMLQTRERERERERACVFEVSGRGGTGFVIMIITRLLFLWSSLLPCLERQRWWNLDKSLFSFSYTFQFLVTNFASNVSAWWVSCYVNFLCFL